MKVGLDITQAVKRRGRGIARYIREIVPRLAQPDLGLEPVCCIRGERWWRRELVGDLAPHLARSWMPFSGWMSTPGVALFHSFGNHLPARSRVPLSFTVHDFRALDGAPGEDGAGGRLRRNIERADGILCLTEHGRTRLLHHYPAFDPRRLAVVPHGVDHRRFRPQDTAQAAETAARLGIERPFFIQLGSWFPHKNLELSLRAFGLCAARAEGYLLVFVGGGAPAAYRAELERVAREAGVTDGVRWIEDVSGDDLPRLLGAAGALLQPSRYEGFALPLLEAMAVGLPGVVSDSSCLPEVSGGIWPIAGQDDAGAFARGMDAMTLDAAARAAAIAAGLQRAAAFSWAESARLTAAFFQRVVS